MIDYFNPTRVQQFCDLIPEKDWNALIQDERIINKETFKVIFSKVSEERQKLTLEVTLPGIIKNAMDLKRIFGWLEPAQIRVVCEQMKLNKKLYTVIAPPGTENVEKTAKLIDLLERLSSEQSIAVIRSQRSDLLQFIVYSKNLDKLLAALKTPEEIIAVIQTLGKEGLNKLGFSVWNIYHVLEAFKLPEERRVVFEFMKDTFPTLLIKNQLQIQELLKLLPEYKDEIFALTKDKWPELIFNLTNFTRVFKPDSEDYKIFDDYREEIYSEIKNILAEEIIKEASDFISVMSYLNPEQQEEICQLIPIIPEDH